MLIQGNLLGFLMFVFSGIFVVIGYFILRLPDWIVMITAGLALSAADLIFRLLKSAQKGWLYKKELGGYLYFIPVWAFGIVVILINIVAHFTKSRG
jgi:hypothetical protein